MARLEHLDGDVSRHPNVVVMHPESASDARETADLVRGCLRRAHRNVRPSLIDSELDLLNLDTVSWQYYEDYPRYCRFYKQVIRQWIFWAISNHVPSSDLQVFPDSTHSDESEGDDLSDSKEDDLSPDDLQGLPNSSLGSNLRENRLHDISSCIQRYITMAQIEHLYGDISRNPGVAVDALRPESASNADNIELWVYNLLKRIHGEVRWINLELQICCRC